MDSGFQMVVGDLPSGLKDSSIEHFISFWRTFLTFLISFLLFWGTLKNEMSEEMLMENKKQIWYDRGTSSSLNLFCHDKGSEAKLILHFYYICRIFTSYTIESVP